MMNKIVIYQVFTRLFGNRNKTCKKNGSIEENGSGKFNDFTMNALNSIRKLGVTHIWFTGVLEHASQTAYEQFGIPADNSAIVKGKAGSPYAIRDYYDVDPDLALDVEHRMKEFENLLARTHKAGLKVLIDFVPNHLARRYHSDACPQGEPDFGFGDLTGEAFSPQNNFYYMPGQIFSPQFDLNGYEEFPAKATGNDCFSPSPSKNDWYETVKLNYGVDYLNGRSEHFDPMPDTWVKMRDILLYWAQKGVDGFRCDMAEMVPEAFWHWAIAEVKKQFPQILFVAEVYQPNLYRSYIDNGFDYLYDKVGLYDTLRSVVCGYRPASDITSCWQQVDDIKEHMLHFMENHDEQRIASDFFAGNPEKGKPAMLVSAMLSTSPVMLYFGQELGEKGMDEEGFSGRDGRTTIFDYWSLASMARWANGNRYDSEKLTQKEKLLRDFYYRLLRTSISEKAITQGEMYDLMWLNDKNPQFNPVKQFAWIRCYKNEFLICVANFDERPVDISLVIDQHPFDFLEIKPNFEQHFTDLLTRQSFTMALMPDKPLQPIRIEGLDGVVLKFKN